MTVTMTPASFGRNTETLREIAQRYLLDANDVSRICCVPPAMARAWLAGERSPPTRQVSVLAHFVSQRGSRR